VGEDWRQAAGGQQRYAAAAVGPEARVAQGVVLAVLLALLLALLLVLVLALVLAVAPGRCGGCAPPCYCDSRSGGGSYSDSRSVCWRCGCWCARRVCER